MILNYLQNIFDLAAPAKTSTLKLHWKPAQAEPPPVPVLKNKGTFWHKLDLPPIDTRKLAQLFEQKTKTAAPQVLFYLFVIIEFELAAC